MTACTPKVNAAKAALAQTEGPLQKAQDYLKELMKQDKKQRAKVSVTVATLDKLVAEHTNNTAEVAEKAFETASKILNKLLKSLKKKKGVKLATAITKCAESMVTVDFK